MNYEERVAQYCSDIDTASRLVLEGEKLLEENGGDIGALRTFISSQVGEVLSPEYLQSLEDLERYFVGVSHFLSHYGKEDPSIQVGRLFGFRPEKFSGDVSISPRGAILMVSFVNMQDLLYAKFAKRREQFSQEDKMSGFYKVINFEGKEVPVCVTLRDYFEPTTITHEMTHFRNSVIGMDFYSQGGGRGIYETFVYDDLQEEILAFFSEGYKRSEIQIAILHDERYHFYKRIEGWGADERVRFTSDVPKYINIAREVKELRPDTYTIDLALIPIHKWERYLCYINDLLSQQKHRDTVE